MKLFPLASLAILVANGALAADKSILELQRDMALLQDQMQTLEQKIATLQTAVQQIAQQSSDMAAKSDARLDKLQAAMDQSVKTAIAPLTGPVAGVASKLDGLAGDVSTLRDASGEMAKQMTSVRSQLDEMNNAIKAMQTPVIAPGASGAPLADAQQVQPSKMFTDASADMNGKQDLALIEFSDFLRLFPNDPMAAQAQFNVGQIHYGLGQFDQAAQDFDTVATKYPNTQQLPDAMLMKGLSLLKASKRPEAIQALRDLIMKFTQSSQASQARDLLRGLAASKPSAMSPSR